MNILIPELQEIIMDYVITEYKDKYNILLTELKYFQHTYRSGVDIYHSYISIPHPAGMIYRSGSMILYRGSGELFKKGEILYMLNGDQHVVYRTDGLVWIIKPAWHAGQSNYIPVTKNCPIYKFLSGH